eukprot:GHVN01012712.1.p1 GENE.GHVN01012712.1~~GHVN01012712.1.p1  ORF type:complete len:593 (+),score=97.11 GHVN01012712.1:311-2089(+)
MPEGPAKSPPSSPPSLMNVSLSTHRLPADLYLDERDLCDLELLLNGAFHPLNRYMGQNEYMRVLKEMRLTGGEVFSMPIVLPVPLTSLTRMSDVLSDAQEPQLAPILPDSSQLVKLRDQVGVIVAEVKVSDLYAPDLNAEAMSVCGTNEMTHPHVAHLMTTHSGCLYGGGEVVAKQPISHFDFKQFRANARQVKEEIAKGKWSNVIGFQTRNPMHRSHFELTKEAVERVSNETGKPTLLLLTPAVGPTQPGDVEYHIRVRCYQKILKEYEALGIPVKLVLLPLAMRMAGPKEAVWHAVVRRNYGCTHFIVGRDHAGPSAKTQTGGSFYGPYEAHELLKKYQSEMGITPVFGKNMVYIGSGGYVQEDQMPADSKPQNVSGTEFRNMLQKRLDVPAWFSFPQVIDELHKHYVPLDQRGFCVYFTGLPCSGKSTLAIALQERLLERPDEVRRVTVLDADIIRRHLSKGLGFSREDRSVNVRRIGYVAAEVVKHGGICLVANIAPYQDDRTYNRRIISEGGAYIEVHVSTPIEVCESRDIKELYKKARQGVIKQFTGVSDPYEPPVNPEVKVDSSVDLDGKIDQVVQYLMDTSFIK